MKRRATTQLIRAEQEPEVATVITKIDPNGDLQLDFVNEGTTTWGLLVNRHTLCLSSPVFRAMLGQRSGFSESANKTLDLDGTQVVRLEDDKYFAIELIMNVIHLQGQNIPRVITFQRLASVAVQCDKYDLSKSLGAWPEQWSRPFLDKVSKPGYDRLLSIAAVLRLPDLFTKSTRHLILHSSLDEDDQEELRVGKSRKFTKGIPASILGQSKVVCRMLYSNLSNF